MDLEVLKEIGLYGGGGLAVILTLIQISPIKVNPWSYIARCIGRAINKEVIDKVDAISVDMNNNKADDDERWVSLSRYHILRFGDELRRGIGHSKEQFDQILEDISKYEHYCDTHPDYPNGKAVAAIELIKKTYQTCLEKNNFL